MPSVLAAPVPQPAEELKASGAVRSRRTRSYAIVLRPHDRGGELPGQPGDVAQLGERHDGIVKVRGSIPLVSTVIHLWPREGMYDYERRRLVAIINKDVAGAVQEEMRKAIAYAHAFIKDAERPSVG